MRSLRPITLVACLLALVAASLAVAQTVARIDTVAGSGTAGFTGDGGPATGAQLATPSDVAFVGGNATYLIADTANNRIRRVNDAGAIATVAGAGPGNAAGGFAGDGLAATNGTVRLNSRAASPPPPTAASSSPTPATTASAASPQRRHHDRRRVAPRPASAATATLRRGASLNQPAGVAACPTAAFLIADTGNNRIRRSRQRDHHTVAGAGPAPHGDGGPADPGLAQRARERRADQPAAAS